MRERDVRTSIVLGEAGVQKLREKKVAVFGLGGVGSYCVEALARTGVGSLILVDKDRVEESNLNRQLPALYSTIGKYKTDIVEERIHDIDRDCFVTKYSLFYLPETADEINLDGVDYIADCIDNVTAKIHLIEEAKRKNVPVISALGAGNRMDPERVHLSDLKKTSVCPLARVMRRELKKRGIEHHLVAWSDEEPVKSEQVGSVCFVPAVMGLLIAGKIVRSLIGADNGEI